MSLPTPPLPPPYVAADESITREDRDFVHEGLALLYEMSSTPDDPYQWKVPETDDLIKHLSLYNWIALSIVRKAQRDVAAIAVSRARRHMTVFYAKNQIEPEDVEHAEQFANLIRNTAQKQTGEQALSKAYFQMMLSNCTDKVLRRYGEFKAAAFTKPKKTAAVPNPLK